MFPSIQGDGRIWIYVANRQLSAAENTDLKTKMSDFCSSWAAHGNQLTAVFDVFHNQILILAVDEQIEAASGCSIDETTAVFRQIEADLQLDLFNRMNLTFLDDNEVRIVKYSKINEAFETHQIDDTSIFLDNTISSLQDLRTKWQVPFGTSWARKRVK